MLAYLRTGEIETLAALDLGGAHRTAALRWKNGSTFFIALFAVSRHAGKPAPRCAAVQVSTDVLAATETLPASHIKPHMDQAAYGLVSRDRYRQQAAIPLCPIGIFPPPSRRSAASNIRLSAARISSPGRSAV